MTSRAPKAGTPSRAMDGDRMPSRPMAGAGFTLIELLVVLTIFVLLLSLVIPSISASLRNWELRSQTAQLISDLRLARVAAVNSKKVHGLRIDLDNDSANRVEAGSLAAMAGAIEQGIADQIEALFLGREENPIDYFSFGPKENERESGVSYILFYPRGNSTGGRMQLRHKSGGPAMILLVEPVTGRVHLEKEDRR